MNRLSKALGPLVIRRSRQRTIAVLVIAAVLMAGILVARLLNTDESNGLLGLQVIPIALVALELGLLPAVFFATAALGTVAVWSATRDIDISAIEYVARATVYFPIAIAVGWAAGRLHVALATIEHREERLRTVVESSTDALVTIDAEDRILAWNPAAERTFGWHPDEVLGKDLAELTMPPRIRELMREGKRRFLEEGDRSMIGVRFESRALTRDEREFPIECSISAVWESDRWIFHVFGHDITERRASQDERKRLASIVESSGDAIFSFNLGGGITSWNPGAERIYGYSEDEAHEMSLFDFAPPDRPDDVGPLLKRVKRGGQVTDVDVERIGKGGRHLEVAETVTPITNAAGTVVGGAAIHRDISDRKRRDRYVAAQHAATSVLARAPEIDHVGPAILPIVSGAGSWLCGAFWVAAGDGLRCDGVWTAPITSLQVSPVQTGEGSTMEPSDTELQWLTAEPGARELPRGERATLGGLRTQLWVPIVVGGELFGAFQFFDRRHRERDDDLVGALIAITDQIGNYIQRRRAEREAERAKDEFFGLVSHELRTPLTSIIGYGELLSESEADRLTEEGRKYLDVIRRNASRELRLVGDLLLLVRIQEGTFRIELEDDVDLRRIVENSVDTARPTAIKRGIDLRAETDASPECRGDPHRLAQVIDNLLSNAIKFTPSGGDVAVRLRTGNGLATIEVTDSGVGIPEGEQAFLFDRLYRAPSATASAVPGVGLGLTIVKAIVDAHHGRIAVESEPGAGASFRVELPVQRPIDNEEVVE